MMSPAGRIALSTALVAVVGSAAVNAQSAGGILDDLSGGCKSAATGLITAPIATCANLNGLVTVITATGSIVDPMNAWVTDLCGQPDCAQADIDSAKTTIESSCASDIKDGNVAAVGLDTIIANFPTVKDAVCTQASTNSSFCITEFLNNAQKTEGQDLTTDFIKQIVGSASSFKSAISKLDTSEVCTDCNKAIYTKIKPILASSTQSSLQNLANQECGATFSDGQLPTTVKEASAANSGASRIAFSAGAAVLAMAGLFALA